MPKPPHARQARRPPAPPALLAARPDSALVRELVDNYLKELAAKGLVYFPAKTSKFSQPKPQARERLDFLAQLLESSPPRGILLSEVMQKLAEVENQRIRPEALKEFVRRYAAFHSMVILGGYLRLQTEKVLEMLRKVG